MLILGHIGYTVGAAWALRSAKQHMPSADYRTVALMAMAPDIIDRTLFVLVLPAAASGRLIAHTLAFQLALFLLLILVRRDWWIYGTASAFHLLLDSTGLSMRWARHVLWPFLGNELEMINIIPHAVDRTTPYYELVWLRFQQALLPYSEAVWLAWLLEFGGAMVLLAFGYRKSMFRLSRLWQFLSTGKI